MSQRQRGHEAVSKRQKSRGQAGPPTHPTHMIIPKNVLSIKTCSPETCARTLCCFHFQECFQTCREKTDFLAMNPQGMLLLDQVIAAQGSSNHRAACALGLYAPVYLRTACAEAFEQDLPTHL